MSPRFIEVPSVVIGSGIAGLSAALGHGDCVVLSKTSVGDGSSRWAQGGIAAAMSDDDTPELHAADTEQVSAGLGSAEIASIVTDAAPDRIQWLLELGANFDLNPDGTLRLGREAGHAKHRIVHANGDATGAEVMRALVATVRERPDIECLDHTLAIDLLMDGGRVVGVLAVEPDGTQLAILARSVVIATGGIGRLYRHTTNPREVAADGLALAIRSGIAIRDPEFVQFHPTALDSTLDPMPLLTEALRGDGAHLVNDSGERFMVEVHPDAELAPRDIVARQIWWQRQDGHAYLDARHLGDDFPERFPTVWKIVQRVGLDPRRDLLPVSPAQHYHMGGIAVDDQGRSSAPGLYAVGEASSTGLHGANRLASNSLLEGLVFGARVATTAATEAVGVSLPSEVEVPTSSLDIDLGPRERDDADIQHLRNTMWEHVGLVRSGEGLAVACEEFRGLVPRLAHHPTGRNLTTAALAITESAQRRTESRGSHFRDDHPSTGSRAAHTELTTVRRPTTRLRRAHRAEAARV